MKTSETIIKYNKEKALKINCRKIKGEYYEKNKDCFFINNKWYRLNSGYIEFDHEKQEYVLKNESMTEGVVDFKDKKIVKGFFTPNIYENVIVRNNNENDDFSIVTQILIEKKEFLMRNFNRDFRDSLKKILHNYYDKIFYSSNCTLNSSPYSAGLFTKYNYYTKGRKEFTMINSGAMLSNLDMIIFLSQHASSLYYNLIDLLGKKASLLIESSIDEIDSVNVGFVFDKEIYLELHRDEGPTEAYQFLTSELENYTYEENSILNSILKLKSITELFNIESIDIKLGGNIFKMNSKIFFSRFPQGRESFESIAASAFGNLNTYVLSELVKDNIALSYILIDHEVFARFAFEIESLSVLGINSSVNKMVKYLHQLNFDSCERYIQDFISQNAFIGDYLNAYFRFERRDFCKKANNKKNITDFNYLAIPGTEMSFSVSDMKYIIHFEEFLNRSANDFLSDYVRTVVAMQPQIPINDFMIDINTSNSIETEEEAPRVISIDNELKLKYSTTYPDLDMKLGEDNLIFINSKVAKKAGYYEIFGTEYFSQSNKKQYPKNGNYSKMNYNVSEEEGQESEIEREIKTHNKNYQIQTLEELEKYEQLLGNKSFGIEYETSKGYIPKRYLYKTGLIPLRDGSLDGGIEYTSLPMSGSTGLQSVLNQCSALNHYCKIDDRCSLHIHVGNVPRTKEFGLALYILFTRIQNELFEIIPPYKRDLEWISRRGKDYCKPLRTLRFSPKSLIDKDDNLIKEKVNSAFSNLFLFLTENEAESKKYNFDTGLHPKHGAGKWNYKSRYYALNLINLYFSKYKTIEFRMHTPTLSQDKTLNWLFICVAIARYAEQNIVKILKGQEKIDLTEIIYGYYDNFSGTNQIIEQGKNLADHLLGYINQRKDDFNYYFIRQRVIDTASVEIEGDKNYKFISENLNWDKLNYNFNKNEQQE